MKSTIMLVEDNEDVLFNTKMTLEMNDYDVITAENGQKALAILKNLDSLPDLIISDIMMPVMNGYDFFKTVSNNPDWSFIPFFFLTARATPDDIRFGKMLGVDDYLTKPFKNEDLLATVTGKIARNKTIRHRIEELVSPLKDGREEEIVQIDKESVILIEVIWDDNRGPILNNFFARELDVKIRIEQIAVQLFYSLTSIYGQGKITEPQGILLKIRNIEKSGYVFFDTIIDESHRGGQRNFMIGVIAPSVSYFQSLQVKEFAQEIANQIKAEEDYDIRQYWEKISGILTLNGK